MNSSNVDKSNAGQDDVSLRDIILKLRIWWKYLLFKWKVIVIAGLIGGALGLTYALIKKPVYKAELSFALQDNGPTGGLSTAAGIASQFGIDLGGLDNGLGAFSGDNILELLKSRLMIENTLLSAVNVNGKRETLAQLYIEFNKLDKDWEDDPLLSKVNYPIEADRSKFTLKQDSMLGVFFRTLVKKNLTVEKVDKKLSIITLNVKSKNELFSKYFAEILVKTVSDFYIDTKTKKSSQNVNMLQRLTDSVRRELNSAITGVASSMDVNPNANPALQILKVPSQHRQVDVEANGAMLTELVKNLELAKVSLKKETPLIQIIDTPILPLEKDKVGKALGIVIGGILVGFFTCIYLIISLTFKNLEPIENT